MRAGSSTDGQVGLKRRVQRNPFEDSPQSPLVNVPPWFRDGKSQEELYLGQLEESHPDLTAAQNGLFRGRSCWTRTMDKENGLLETTDKENGLLDENHGRVVGEPRITSDVQMLDEEMEAV